MESDSEPSVRPGRNSRIASSKSLASGLRSSTT